VGHSAGAHDGRDDLRSVAAGTGVAAAPRSLVASRPLAVLDEFRVPYLRPDGATRDDPWPSLSAGTTGQALHWYAGGRGEGETPGHYTVRGIPIVGGVAAERQVAERARALPGAWCPWPEVEVLDRDGSRYASAWRSDEGGTILPFDPDEIVLGCRSESYRDASAPAGEHLKAVARRAYYGVRPLMPRRLQISLRRGFSRVQARAAFPRWPVETALHDLADIVLRCAADAVGGPLPYLAPWPRGRTWALVLTHDVETAAGRDAIGRVRAVEAAAGLRSSWNLVPERYAVPDRLVAELTAAGCEIGVHGLRHDGRDLESRRTLGRRLPEMHRWAERWGAVGFRAPATQRGWDLMPMLGFEYDSSYPDTDPFEPIAGGCCSWLPFFNDTIVELPITVPQDHTVFVILRRGGAVWHAKVEELSRRGGMALVLTHPDYLGDDAPLPAYERFVQAYSDDRTAWTALPREVSDWWRRRAATSLCHGADGWRAEGPAAADATIAFAGPRAVRP